MKKYKIVHTPFYYFTLFSLGILLLVASFLIYSFFASRFMTKKFKEQIYINAELEENLSKIEKDKINNWLKDQQFVLIGSVEYVDKENALKQMEKEMGAELLVEGMQNPFPDIIRFHVSESDLNQSSLENIRKKLTTGFPVTEVHYPRSIFTDIEANLKTITSYAILIVIVLLLMVAVLIHHLMRLNIIANRFLIRTMQMVGATRGFIRKPFLLSAAKMGFISAITAVGAFFALLMIFKSQLNLTQHDLQLDKLPVIFVAVLVMSLVLCVFSSFLAIQKYLDRSYGELL